MTYTNDPAKITRVWVSFEFDDVFTGDLYAFDSERDGDHGEDSEAKLARAYDRVADAIAEQFPAATDVWIENTGWEGALAQFSPRADNPDAGLDYEPFYEWLSALCDSLQEV